MINRESDFQSTMRGLERGLLVEHIAEFSMLECSPNDELVSVRAQMDNTGFDQIPVRENGMIVGVVDRAHLRGQTATDSMQPLQESMLIAASDPLETLLPLFGEGRYRLVVHRGGIDGIVTQSDLIKLPVRLYAFGKITFLEMLMADRINHEFDDEAEWMRLLNSDRRSKVRWKQRKASEEGLDPSLVELTEYGDKRDVLEKHLALGQDFTCEVTKVELLRNTLAHAGDYSQTQGELKAFLERLALAEKWIEYFMASTPAAPSKGD